MRDTLEAAVPIQLSAAGFVFACPVCRGPLEAAAPGRQHCAMDGMTYSCIDGIWRFLPPERAAYFAPFLRDYTAIRAAEGYGYDDPARYRHLPDADPADPMAWQWRMRARSFACLRRRVLARMEGSLVHIGRNPFPVRTIDDRRWTWIAPRRVLDLGAGVGWLSNRLALLGHHPCAVDLNLDSRDGLGAARHYATTWPRVQAEFDRLPLADGQADIMIYNASLHYSAGYRATLAEALRVLRPGGRIVVMDSPIYRRDASGRQMIAERQVAFARDHGSRSDALPSVGYLTWAMLRDLERELGLRWQVARPWYGWRWALRPWRARLAGRREPSTFALLIARRSGEG